MTIIDILFFLLTALGISYLYFWAFRQYRIDRFRQNVFAVRDDLFMYAAEGNIDFNHPAYTTLRNVLNGYIRFSHRISFLHLVLHTNRRLGTQDQTLQFEKIWENATAGLNQETRLQVETFRLTAEARLFYFVFLSTVLKKLIAIPFILLLIGRNLWTKMRPRNDEILILNQNTQLRLYQYSERRSEHIKNSLKHLNTDAIALAA
jgi:hypothetical protein